MIAQIEENLTKTTVRAQHVCILITLLFSGVTFLFAGRTTSRAVETGTRYQRRSVCNLVLLLLNLLGGGGDLNCFNLYA